MYDAAAMLLHDPKFTRPNLPPVVIDGPTSVHLMQMLGFLSPNNSSGHKGVYWVNHFQRWKATYRRGGVQIVVGMYATREEAIQRRTDHMRSAGLPADNRIQPGLSSRR